MRIISWNINGIKAHFDGLRELIDHYQPDIVCLQKVKSKKGIEAFPIEGYSMFDLPLYRSQWYGVGTYYRNLSYPLMNFPNKLAVEGHLQALDLHIGNVELFNVYTPFSNPTKSEFIEARKAYDPALSLFAQSQDKSPLILCGDFNVVDQSQDYFEQADHSRPCFFPWEIDNFRKLMQDNDLVDVYRELHPQERGYTYFDSRDSDRVHGARIDYFLVSRSLLPLVQRCEIIRDITVSNSNPLLLDIDLGVSAVPPRYRESSQGLDQKASIANV